MYANYEERRKRRYPPTTPNPEPLPRRFDKPRVPDLPEEVLERLRKRREITNLL